MKKAIAVAVLILIAAAVGADWEVRYDKPEPPRLVDGVWVGSLFLAAYT